MKLEYTPRAATSKNIMEDHAEKAMDQLGEGTLEQEEVLTVRARDRADGEGGGMEVKNTEETGQDRVEKEWT